MTNYDRTDSRIFAVRETLLDNKKERQKLRKFIKKGGKIPDMTVAVGFHNNLLQLRAPFLPTGFTYDATKFEVFSERKLRFSVSVLLQQEGEQSIFFHSEKLLLRRLDKKMHDEFLLKQQKKKSTWKRPSRWNKHNRNL